MDLAIAATTASKKPSGSLAMSARPRCPCADGVRRGPACCALLSPLLPPLLPMLGAALLEGRLRRKRGRLPTRSWTGPVHGHSKGGAHELTPASSASSVRSTHQQGALPWAFMHVSCVCSCKPSARSKGHGRLLRSFLQNISKEHFKGHAKIPPACVVQTIGKEHFKDHRCVLCLLAQLTSKEHIKGHRDTLCADTAEKGYLA
eukprot:1159557-Pelagomonas_calceolata.AAC.9